MIDLIEFVLTEAGGYSLVDSFIYGLEVAETEVGYVGSVFQEVIAELTLGL